MLSAECVQRVVDKTEDTHAWRREANPEVCLGFAVSSQNRGGRPAGLPLIFLSSQQKEAYLQVCLGFAVCSQKREADLEVCLGFAISAQKREVDLEVCLKK